MFVSFGAQINDAINDVNKHIYIKFITIRSEAQNTYFYANITYA